MPWYKVELNGSMTLVQARTANGAALQAMRDYFGSVRVTIATKEDAAWHQAMGGHGGPIEKAKP